VIDEAERSIHDALCVIRCLVKKRAVIVGGGAPEIEVALRLSEYAATVTGVQSYVLAAFAEALEVIPFTLAENAGLSPIATVTELRAAHKNGEISAGINVRKGCITDIKEENVVQPLLVNMSAVSLATEVSVFIGFLEKFLVRSAHLAYALQTVRSILKVDDIINTI
jgi:T-complex protein 1 subunit delta